MENTALESFRSKLHGELIRPGDPSYESARKVYNGMIARYPALIVRCAETSDVVAAVEFGRDHDVALAVRCGGHNGAGLGVVDNGLVVDLAAMKGVQVDAASQTVRVAGGCTWGDVDRATQTFGLAVPSGTISTTGVAGLTLGGGHGYLTRKYGLTIDNLLSARVVLADGRVVTASEEEHPDLFWALRGGGGNFGVVTSFRFKAHPVATVQAGITLWDSESAAQVLRWYRDFMVQAPHDVYGFFAFLTVPPGEPFPQPLHGRRMCGIVWCHTGSAEAVERTFAEVLAVQRPAFHHVGPTPYTALQTQFDALMPAGLQWYWKGDFVREISDDAIALHLEHAARVPTPLSTMHLYPVDGAAHQIDRRATAFSYREANWSAVYAGIDPDPANAERIASWAREYWQALHPHSAGGAYVNFLMDEGEERVFATYRDNYARLASVKRTYDPNNLFRVNQNIQPEGGA